MDSRWTWSLSCFIFRSWIFLVFDISVLQEQVLSFLTLDLKMVWKICSTTRLENLPRFCMSMRKKSWKNTKRELQENFWLSYLILVTRSKRNWLRKVLLSIKTVPFSCTGQECWDFASLLKNIQMKISRSWFNWSRI